MILSLGQLLDDVNSNLPECLLLNWGDKLTRVYPGLREPVRICAVPCEAGGIENHDKWQMTLASILAIMMLAGKERILQGMKKIS